MRKSLRNAIDEMKRIDDPDQIPLGINSNCKFKKKNTNDVIESINTYFKDVFIDVIFTDNNKVSDARNKMFMTKCFRVTKFINDKYTIRNKRTNKSLSI